MNAKPQFAHLTAGSDAPRDSERLAIKLIQVGSPGRPIAVGCAEGSGYGMRSSHRMERNLAVVRQLWRFLSEQGLPGDWHIAESPESWSLAKDRFGRPFLRAGRGEGPSVSFSHSRTTTWAALSGHRGPVGIDVAEDVEFPADYPRHRAFHREELLRALAVNEERSGPAAALGWSAKEAAVKALGYGFHLIDPLDLMVERIGRVEAALVIDVTVAYSVFRRLPVFNDGTVSVLAFRTGTAWISVAAVPKHGSRQSR